MRLPAWLAARDRLVIRLDQDRIRWSYFPDTGKALCNELFLHGRNILEIKSSLPKKPSQVILMVGRDEMLAKELRLPSTNPKELERIVAYKLPHELPYDISEIVYHSDIAEITPDGYADVRVLWTLRANVDQKLKTLENLGLPVDQVLLSTQCVFFYHQKIREKDSTFPSELIFFVMDHHETELIEIADDKIVSSHIFKKGREDYEKNAAGYTSELISEIEAIVKKRGHKLFICTSGIQEKLSGLQESLFKTFGVPAKIIHPASLLDIKNESCADPGLMGAAFYQKYAHSSLLPQDIKLTRTTHQRAKGLKEVAFFSAGLMMLSASALYLNVLAQQVRKESLAAEFREIYPRVKDVLKIAQEMELIEKLQSRKSEPLEILAGIGSVMPQEITLSQLDYDEKDGLRVRGLGETHQVITEFMKGLRTLPRISKAEFDFSRRKLDEGREKFDFQITATIDWKERSF